MGRGDIIAIACILLLFLLFAIGVVALQCCFNECHRRRAQQAAAASAAAQSGGARWLDQTARKADGDPEAPPTRPLPPAVKVVHRAATAAARSKEEDAGAGVEECAVCLAGLQDGEEARFLPCCNHGFHAQCVDTWLASRSTCPLCRVTFATTNVAPPPASALPPPVPAGRVSRIRDLRGEVTVATL